jgi:hypothetical protein
MTSATLFHLAATIIFIAMVFALLRLAPFGLGIFITGAAALAIGFFLFLAVGLSLAGKDASEPPTPQDHGPTL